METYYRVLNTGVLKNVASKVASSVRVFRVWGGESIGGELTRRFTRRWVCCKQGGGKNVTQISSSVFSAGVFTGLFNDLFSAI